MGTDPRPSCGGRVCPDLAGDDGGDPVTGEPRFDVVAQNIKTGTKRLIDTNRTEKDAEGSATG